MTNLLKTIFDDRKNILILIGVFIFLNIISLIFYPKFLIIDIVNLAAGITFLKLAISKKKNKIN